MRRFWIALLLAGFLRAGHLPFRLFTTEDGLARNWTTRIRRDSKGYLWFCTVEGFSIFDGYRFSNFSTGDGLPNRMVSDILETRNGEYWIATSGGLSLFHPTVRGGARFENFRIGATDASNQILVLLENSAGIWAGTSAGLYRVRPSGRDLRVEPIPLKRDSVVPVRALLEDSQHRIWAGSQDGIYVRSADGRVEVIGPDRGAPSGVNELALDSRGHVWAGGAGLTEYVPNAETIKIGGHFTQWSGAPLRIWGLASTANGDVWIGAKGLLRLRPGAADFQTVPSLGVLHEPGVSGLCFDADSNLWMSISNLGAGRLSREPAELFEPADGLDSASVVGLTEDRKGRFYAITGPGHVLNEYVGDGFKPRPWPVPLGGAGWGYGAVAIQDHLGSWWLASARGVLQFSPTDDPRTLSRLTAKVHAVVDGIPDSMILRLFEDSRGDVWAGTPKGLARWSRSSRHWTTYGPQKVVLAITQDHAGTIWAGYDQSALLRIRESKAEFIADGVPKGFINSLLVDHAGRLWIASSQNGLGRIDNTSAEHLQIRGYNSDDGLLSNHLFSLAEDKWGRIYAAGGKGVDRLDPATGAIRHFSEANGLPPGETERLLRDRQGAIWFASNFGLSRYQPEADKSGSPPAPLLRGLNIAGAAYSLSVLGERSVTGLELAPDQTRVGLEYRALHFYFGERLRYQYRLAGASSEWSAPAEAQTVEFANLAPGNYRFEVRSVGETGLISSPATVEFRLLPPFWRRTWFVALIAGLMTASAYGLHRYRLNELLAVERVRTRLATDLHDDLGAGLAEIAILTEVAKRKPAKGVEALDHVARQARSLRASLGDIVWTIDPQRDRLSDLVYKMRETALTLLQTDDRSVHFVAPEREQMERIELLPELRRHLLLFFKEAITNVARHSGATSIAIEISLTGRKLVLRIRDNGRGFDPEASTSGHGLPGMRYRAAEMRGRLRLESAAEAGTGIDLQVDLGL